MKMDCVALIKMCQLPLRPSSLGKLRLLLCYDSIKIIHKNLAISLSALVPATLVSPLKILRFLITVSPKCPTAGAMPYMFYVFPQMAYYPTLREKKPKQNKRKNKKLGLSDSTPPLPVLPTNLFVTSPPSPLPSKLRELSQG